MSKETEHKIQNDIRNMAAGKMLLFRANVGSGWTGIEHKLPNGDILLKNPRRFSTGLPAGFSDLFGLIRVKITPDMVGQEVGIFVAAEIKTPTGRVSEKQKTFREAVINNGGLAYVWRSVEQAQKDVDSVRISD